MTEQLTLHLMLQILNTTESYSGLVGSETLTLTGQGSVASKNVSGSSQSVTMGTIALGNQSGATTSSNWSSK